MDVRSVTEAIEPLRSGFQADGVDLRVASATEEQVTIWIVLGDEACRECMMPVPILEQIFQNALREAGLGQPQVSVVEIEDGQIEPGH